MLTKTMSIVVEADPLAGLRGEVERLKSSLKRIEHLLSDLETCGVREDPAAVPGGKLALSLRPDGTFVELGSACVALTRREALLLDLLMSGNSPVPREQILRSFYPNGDSRSGNILDVYVSHLRQKLRMISGGLDLIENIPGAGFRLRGDLLPRSTEDLVEERVVAEQSLVGRTSEMNIAGAGRRLTPLMQMG